MAWLWAVFGCVVAGTLALDLFVLHRDPREVRIREAVLWSGIWIGLALGFMALVAWSRGWDTALEFLTCYLIEESLSVDNLFVFLVIFSYFSVPKRYHHKALFWGVLGAVVMRAAFIFLGIELILLFEWLVYVLGGVLVITGIRMAFERQRKIAPERNLILRLFRRLIPVTPDYEGDRFFVRREGRRRATPLFVVLLVIETTDVVFAIDSVPAALAITLDPLVVYTSNIFAVLGLRSLYFALAGLMPMFSYLRYGLSVILALTGLKMICSYWGIHVPIGWALGSVGGILLLSIAGSIVAARLAPARGGG